MEAKYWEALSSDDYSRIQNLIQTLLDRSLSDPDLIRRELNDLGIDDEGEIFVPADAPENILEAPHLRSFLHWKKGFVAAQRVAHKRNSIQAFLQSDDIEQVRQGLGLLEALAMDSPNIFDLIVGEIHEKKYGIQIPKWLMVARYRCYVCVYTLAWKAENGVKSQVERTELKMASYGAYYIPENIGAFSNLKILSYGESRISELPQSVTALQNLEEFSLSEAGLEIFPEVLFSLPNLREIRVSDNLLKVIPENIGLLSSLQALSIEGNPLTALPDAMEKLSDLRALNLSWTDLKSFPICATKLSSLKHLALRGAHFETLPEEFSRLTSLKKVSLDKKQESLKEAILSFFPQMEFGFVY